MTWVAVVAELLARVWERGFVVKVVDGIPETELENHAELVDLAGADCVWRFPTE